MNPLQLANMLKRMGIKPVYFLEKSKIKKVIKKPKPKKQ
tara:strand:+ start:213 stop:329 length:117 start_codon:yes stop_codon:yes gene_type:complete